MKEAFEKVFEKKTMLSKGDVFLIIDDGVVDYNNCFLVDEICVVGEGSNVELFMTNLCRYDELFELVQKDLMSGPIGGDLEYSKIDLDYVVVVAHILDSSNLYLGDDDTCRIMEFDNVELDFGEYDEEMEDKFMKNNFTEVIVNCPSVAKEFLRSYQTTDIDTVAAAYDLEPDQVDKVLNSIKMKYRARHTYSN